MYFDYFFPKSSNAMTYLIGSVDEETLHLKEKILILTILDFGDRSFADN
jgi:hypothetical protein